MLTLVKNIKELVGVENTPQLRKQGKEMGRIESVKDAYLLVEDDKIRKYLSITSPFFSPTSAAGMCS